MSKNWQKDVEKQMIEVYECPVRTSPTIDIPEEELSLRYDLILEEMCETLDALLAEDIVAVADGIVDSITVLLGTASALGIDIQPIWDEVAKTNMAKKGGPLRDDGKRLKPPGWLEPAIAALIEEQIKKNKDA